MATGVLGWRPADFWLATPQEVFAALEGWKEAHGDVLPATMTRDRLDELADQFG